MKKKNAKLLGEIERETLAIYLLFFLPPHGVVVASPLTRAGLVSSAWRVGVSE
jgi:hypothetical protein